MKYKPDEAAWMAYLYGELEGEDKEKMVRYLAENPNAQQQLNQMKLLRQTLGAVKDKEVIAPPVFVEPFRRRLAFVHTPYFRVLAGIAASLVLLLVAGKLTDFRIHVTPNALTVGFGAQEPQKAASVPELTTAAVQVIIDSSMDVRQQQLMREWEKSHEQLTNNFQRNMKENTDRMDQLMQQASLASQQQVRDYVASLQVQQMQQVKAFYELNATDQKQYMEELLVDFARYLQQQRNDDLMLMQTRLNHLEQNTDMFKQETEQILSGIISNASLTTIRN